MEKTKGNDVVCSRVESGSKQETFMRPEVTSMRVVAVLAGLLLQWGSAAPAADSAPGPAAGGDLMFHSVKAGRVLFLGNSITLHGPAPAIGWEGNWGMAASTVRKTTCTLS